MKQLYEICKSPTKIWKALPGGDHNSSVIESGYFDEILAFIENLEKFKEK
jgi:abhydrolase domain-containing protein 13